ncbi:MAG: DNA helicase II [Alteromonadaceae bacterium]|nr:MAG: DNA helicase II [Alteromonadaceae bacterium]
MNTTDLTQNLNDAQREAVCAPACNQLVLAGAGSGKTRVLVQRIGWLIQSAEASPHEILAVTFTNKAAREMRERLNEAVGGGVGGYGARSLWVGTFHGLAHRLLKMHWQEAGLPQNFQVLDSDDQLRLIKRIYQQLNIDDSKWPFRQAQGFINTKKDEGIRSQHIQDDYSAYTSNMRTIYAAYEEACERGGMVDFAELLLRSHELWLKSTALLQHYQQRFRFILVDEFQDTNTVQYAWLRVLAGQSSKVTAVGDDDQSIYGWRGAKIENIHKFEKDFAPVNVTRLEQNYRSTATILNAANALIANNTDRLGKSLWTEGEDGEKIDLYAAFNEQDEARYIVDRIQSWVNSGRSLSEVAILYRSNAQSRVLEEACIREQVAYKIYGGHRFYERMEIKNALAYLRLLLNRDDDVAFERVINTPTRGIGGKSLESVRLVAQEQGCSLYSATVKLVKQGVLTARANNALNTFLLLVEELENITVDMSLGDLTEYVVKHSGLLDFHAKEKGEKGQARVENLQELASACRLFTPEDDSVKPLREFLDTAALDSGDTQADEYESAIQMMTLHSAKGLEFPMVFLAGVEENLFPHQMSAEDPERMEEERRLCYVGITRAMERLVISYAESRRMHGKEKFNAVSRFVRELPSALMQEVRIKSTITRPTTYGKDYGGVFATKVSSSSNVHASNEAKAFITKSDEYSGFTLGQSVVHAKFGEGVIMQFEGKGARTQVHVNFPGLGVKRLMLEYAKLEPLV